MNFESLNTIEGLDDGLKAKVIEAITPDVSNHIKAVTGQTFGDIDKFVSELTGSQKEEGLYTSKFIRQALPDWKAGVEANASKSASDKYLSEINQLKADLENKKGDDAIFDKYTTAQETLKQVQEDHAKALKELQEKHAYEVGSLKIASHIPRELNEGVYAPWRDKVQNHLIESGLTIVDGKIQPHELTKGIAIDVKDYVKTQFPELEGVFKPAADFSSGQKSTPSASLMDVQNVGDFEKRIGDMVLEENEGLRRSDAKFIELVDAKRTENKELYDRL